VVQMTGYYITCDKKPRTSQREFSCRRGIIATTYQPKYYIHEDINYAIPAYVIYRYKTIPFSVDDYILIRVDFMTQPGMRWFK
jgi:hypothetical protein